MSQVLIARLLAVMPEESTIDREQQAAAVAAKVARVEMLASSVFRRPSAGLGGTNVGSLYRERRRLADGRSARLYARPDSD